MNKALPERIRRARAKRTVWLAIGTAILLALGALIAYVAYPRTTLTMGVQRNSLEANGNPRAGSVFEKLKLNLAENGITLEFRTQTDDANERPMMEWMAEQPNVDFVIASNTGATLPAPVLQQHVSLGVISNIPILFFARAGDQRFKNARDMQGKRLVYWSSPEGAPLTGAAKKNGPSPYSTDYSLFRVLKQAGITPENTQLVNVWNKPVTMDLEWDVWISVGLPVKPARGHNLWKEISNGSIEMIRFSDLEGLSRGLPEMKLGVMPASAFMPQHAVPATDVTYLAFTRSAVAKKNLDPSLALALSEALKKTYSPQSLLNNKGAFPTFGQSEAFKPEPIAEDFYRNGKPLLNQYLSPTLASFIFKLLVIMVPVIAIVLPAFGYLSRLYQFYVTNKVTKWTVELERIEFGYEHADETTRQEMRKKMEEILADLRHLRFPILHRYFASQAFSARGYAEKVRDKLSKM